MTLSDLRQRYQLSVVELQQAEAHVLVVCSRYEDIRSDAEVFFKGAAKGPTFERFMHIVAKRADTLDAYVAYEMALSKRIALSSVLWRQESVGRREKRSNEREAV